MIKWEKGMPLPLGVTISSTKDKIMLSVWAKKQKKCKLVLYKNGEKQRTISMFSMEEDGARDVFSILIEGDTLEDEILTCEYMFEWGGNEYVDPYAMCTVGREQFGNKKKIRGGFSFENYSWENENRSLISYEDMILYQCHVRGFTKHESSGVKFPGTFAGVEEKIPYLKELGVNTLLFLPIYEFNEIMDEEASDKKKINYWGYSKDAYYFAPKQSYGNGSTIVEFKKLVKTIHQNEMNIMLDFHFEGKDSGFILDCLRYYVLEYHIDGFMINQNMVSADLIIRDPILQSVKFLGTGWNSEDPSVEPGRLAEFHDGFLVDARRYLKSDEGVVAKFYQRFKAKKNKVASINYLTQKNGFTLQDLVSYDVKHNEANGEKNLDGTEYNYSWNCGVEGPTRRKSIVALRQQQRKNALCMLLLSLGTPMLLSGDEFSNTQKGNNNAYCQDNSITWLDWTLLDKNHDFFEFVKELIAFRKEQKQYHVGALTGMDYKGLGAPDISCHGVEPWVTNFVNYARELGVLFYGSYFPVNSTKLGESIYIGFNMHWEPHEFYLPVVASNKKWKVRLDTTSKTVSKEYDAQKNKYILEPRTIVVFETVDVIVSKGRKLAKKDAGLDNGKDKRRRMK